MNTFATAQTSGQEEFVETQEVEAPQEPPTQEAEFGSATQIATQPSATISSTKAREATQVNQAQLADIRKQFEDIGTGLDKTSQQAEQLRQKELATKKEPTEEVDPLQQQVDDAGSAIDTETNQFIELLDARSASLDSSSKALVRSIQSTFSRRRSQQRQINEATLKGTRVAGIRAGRQRFAPEIQNSIMSAEEAAGLQRLANLDAQELSLITEANQANEDNQFNLLNQKMTEIRNARREKTQLIKDLHTMALQEEQNQRERAREEREVTTFDRTEQTALFESLAPSILSELTNDAETNDALIEQIAKEQGIDNVQALKSAVLEFERESREKPIFKTVGNTLLKIDPFTGASTPIFTAPTTTDPQQVITNTLKLRGEFKDDSKNFITIRDAFGRILSSVEGAEGPGDLALIFSFMKVLDPGSVVRESEFATAQDAASFLQRTYSKVARFETGGRLSDESRQEFLDTARQLFESQLDQQQSLQQEYRTTATEFGLNPERVAPNLNAVLELKDSVTDTQVSDLSNKLTEAEEQGFSPGEILDLFQVVAIPLAREIGDARNEGWTDEDIIEFLKDRFNE